MLPQRRCCVCDEHEELRKVRTCIFCGELVCRYCVTECDECHATVCHNCRKLMDQGLCGKCADARDIKQSAEEDASFASLPPELRALEYALSRI